MAVIVSNVGSVPDMLTLIRLEGSLATDEPTDTQLLLWINLAWARLHDIMLSANPNYFLKTADISVVSGTQEYALPSDFYIERAVQVTISGVVYYLKDIVLKAGTQHQPTIGDPATANRLSTGYIIAGEYIRFMPTPTWTGTATIWYGQCATDLAANDVAVKVRNRWGEFIIASVLYKIAMSKGMGEGQARQRMQDEEKRIQQMSKIRSQLGTYNKIDVYRNAGGQ